MATGGQVTAQKTVTDNELDRQTKDLMDGKVDPGEIASVQAKLECLRNLKNKQTAALAAVREKRNELSRLTNDTENLHLVKKEFGVFHDLCGTYGEAFNRHLAEILSEDDMDKETKLYEEKQIAIMAFNKEISRWIHQTEDQLSQSLDNSSTVSSRTHHSKYSQKSSKSSKSSRSYYSERSIRSVHLKEKAKLAELLIEKANLKREQKLREEQDALKLDIKIAKTQAREKIFADLNDAGEMDLRSKKSVNNSPADAIVNEPTISMLSAQAEPFRPIQNRNKSGEEQQSIFTVPVDKDNSWFRAQQQMATAMMLPQPEVPKFSGDPMDYIAFMMAFDARILPHLNNDADKLYFLDQQLTGAAKDLVGGCLYMDANEGYQEARHILQKEYGDPYKVATAFVRKVQTWPTIKPDDADSLKKFVTHLTKCSHAMKSISHMSVLNHSPNMQTIIKKVPVQLQGKWREHVMTLRRKGVEIEFKHIVGFLHLAAEAADDPVFGKAALNESFTNTPQASSCVKTKSFAVQLDGRGSVDSRRRCVLCDQEHDLDNCVDFTAKAMHERKEFLRHNHLCFSCYGSNHVSKGCTNKRQCKLCNKRHPTAMHDNNFQIAPNQKTETVSNKTSVSPNTRSSPQEKEIQDSNLQKEIVAAPHNDSVSANTCTSFLEKEMNSVWQPILPVKVYQEGGYPENVIETYALYDNGSTGCFITEYVQEQIQAVGSETTLKMKTMHGVEFVQTSAVENLVVMDMNNENKIKLPKAFTREEIPVSHNQIPKPELLNTLSHLQPLANKLPKYRPSLEIGLLIGMNCPAALQPLQVTATDGNGPYAALYRHGWTINGPLHIKRDPSLKNSITCNRVVIQELESSKEELTPVAVLKMFDRDFSEHDNGQVPGERGHSVEDSKFLRLAETNLKLKNGHYELPLPLRHAEVYRSNREQALKRAEGQKRKMQRNEKYKEHYIEFMDKLMEKSAVKIVTSELWYNGPNFLNTDEKTWTKQPEQFMSMENSEDECVHVVSTKCNDEQKSVRQLLHHYSSWYRLKKAVAMYRRFIHFLQTKNTRKGSYSVSELEEAERVVVKLVQEQEFGEEMKKLENCEHSVSPKSAIYKLDPFLDKHGVLRVGGRLQRSTLSYEAKHPMLLPKKGHVTDLVIRDQHVDLKHSGRSHVLRALRERLWVLNGNSAVRRVLHTCFVCMKLWRPCLTQKMADLPPDRVSPSPPFGQVGVDLFGPYTVKEGRKILKRYGVLFTCLASRAVHRETVNSLRTDSFINALRRFMSRRGRVHMIRCDNGTNFHGAESELKKCLHEMDKQRVEQFLLKHNVQWHFNPPSASHMGGVWERMIRSVRKVLAPLLLEHGERLDDESLRTLLCEVESIVNSRPLTSVNEDFELEPLTPNHLLTQKTRIVPPPGNFEQNDIYARQQWRRVQLLADEFWRRWKREFLVSLQQRQKWNKKEYNVKTGDLVLIKDENAPRNEWSMGRVVETQADSKGIVRSVVLKTQSQDSLQRPIHKLVLLIANESG